MKRKYLDRYDWNRVLRRRYVEKFIDERNYSGYISLLSIDEVKEPLIINVNGDDLVLADKGIKWLQFLPENANYAMTVMLDKNNKAIQWYFDIIKGSGVEDGRVFFDDLYLDVVHLPSQVTLLIDEDDLEEALVNNIISKSDYDLAYVEAKKIMKELKNGESYIVNHWNIYMNCLLEYKKDND
ncbi:DUF402 domain-containing protein [Vallitalea okinawensis]|uniref:DUF402 domain-containing protein n=1 Tax=Vallitalea okinawensis TaxID=2078660 RepID=UPI000CFDA399|nr:DUF402 domain-containing protein [Vallitalea okinawensis]